MRFRGKATMGQRVGAALGCLLLFSSTSFAQLAPTVQDWVGGASSWNDDANWTNAQDPAFSGVPDITFDDQAAIGNGNPMIGEAVPDVLALMLNGGTVDVQQGGSLKVDAKEAIGGDTTIAGGGVLRLSGNGSFETVGLANSGLIDLIGNDVNIQVGGNLSNSGTIAFDVTSAGNPSISVGGAASVGGTIAARFNGVAPELGDSYEFISGANSVTNNGARIDSGDVTLPRGVDFGLTTSDSTASITVRNVPVLAVNRVSGKTEIKNIVGDPLSLTGYSIYSDNALLNVDGWNSLEDQSVAGWMKANPRDVAIAELNVGDPSSVEVGGAVLDLGNTYRAGPVLPADEDLRFEVSLDDGSVVAGLVEFEGPPNNLTLRVNPGNGEAEISHQSPFIDPFDITAYNILSESGSLSVGGWNSLTDDPAEADWIKANPGPNAIAEINPTGSKLFANGTEFALGEIFTVGAAMDLTFEFTTVDGDQVLMGTVQYGDLGGGIVVPGDCNGDGVADIMDANCTPDGQLDGFLATLNPPSLRGDADGDGQVQFSDFVILSENFTLDGQYTDGDFDKDGVVQFSDFVILSESFGQTGGAVAAAVPEPASWGLFCMGIVCLLGRHRRIR